MRRFIGGLLIVLGMLTATAALAQGVTFPGKLTRVPGSVMAGRIMTKVDPIYPPEAREKGVQGAVVMHAVIGADGVVQDLRIISGPALLQSAALEAARQWTYEAYVVNGSTVAVDTTITIRFLVNDDVN